MGIDLLLAGRTFGHKLLELLPLLEQQNILLFVIGLDWLRGSLSHFASPLETRSSAKPRVVYYQHALNLTREKKAIG
jgi:hypothetical protein